MLNVGIVKYINTLPLTAAFLKGVVKTDVNLIFDVPAKLNGALRCGKIDLGLVSSAEFLDDQNSCSIYQQLPGFGICAHDKILSVNFYIKKNLAELDQAKIGLTAQSATSVSLLKVLCTHFWKVSPIFEILPAKAIYEKYDGLLLIGDEALRNLSIEGFKTIDLAQAWYHATGLPFVFALFSVRTEIYANQKTDVAHFLDQISFSLSWSEQNMAYIEELAYKKCSLQKSLITKYYKTCKYRLGLKEMRGLELFAQLKKGLT